MNLMVYNGQNIHLLMRLMCAVISGVHTNLLQNIFIFVSIKLGLENIDAYPGPTMHRYDTVRDSILENPSCD